MQYVPRALQITYKTVFLFNDMDYKYCIYKSSVLFVRQCDGVYN